MSNPFEPEEVESLTSTSQREGQRSLHRNKSTLRPWHLVLVSVVAFVAALAFFTDGVQIKINVRDGAASVREKDDSLGEDPVPTNSSSQAGNTPTTSTGDTTGAKPTTENPGKASKPIPAPTVIQPAAVTKTMPAFVEKPGFKLPEPYHSERYLRRGKPLTEAQNIELAQKWGSWTLVDTKQRPLEDFYANYPSRDVPYSQFPPNSWQTDKEYLAKFVPEGLALINRAIEAILTEYGHGKFDEPDKNVTTRSYIFDFDIRADRGGEGERRLANKGNGNGWTTQKSFDGLVRRILHAVMTEDTFTFVMGGHSSAAGHGNHFQQSYTLQFQKLMEPVFARLGVKFTAHNMGMGGLGTLQNTIGLADIYGRDIDMLMWDSGMTERGSPVSVMGQQGLIATNRAPFLVSGSAESLINAVGADGASIADPENGMRGVPLTVNATQLKTLPWAAQYLNCDKDMAGECRKNEYRGVCWIPRDDVTPKSKQKAEPGGRAKWHPGDRQHGLRARALAFFTLRAMQRAFEIWNATLDYKLSDEAWHVNAHYKNIREKAMAVGLEVGDCKDVPMPRRACILPMQSRTEFTPRANPHLSNIRSLLKEGVKVTDPAPNEYDPPDVRNPNIDVPDGVFEYLAVVENGVDFAPNRMRRKAIMARRLTAANLNLRKLVNPAITPGKGFELNSNAGHDICDGTYDSFCNRNGDCLLYGHNDGRKGIMMDGLSGWLVMNLPNFRNGLIFLKFETWHGAGSVSATQDWVCENGASSCRRRLSFRERALNSSAKEQWAFDQWSNHGRLLKASPPPYCPDFRFEYAVDGTIRSLNSTEFLAVKQDPERVVELVPILDEPDYTKGKTRDVELAVRIKGCDRSKVFQLTHVYWS